MFSRIKGTKEFKNKWLYVESKGRDTVVLSEFNVEKLKSEYTTTQGGMTHTVYMTPKKNKRLDRLLDSTRYPKRYKDMNDEEKYAKSMLVTGSWLLTMSIIILWLGMFSAWGFNFVTGFLIVPILAISRNLTSRKSIDFLMERNDELEVNQETYEKLVRDAIDKDKKKEEVVLKAESAEQEIYIRLLDSFAYMAMLNSNSVPVNREALLENQKLYQRYLSLYFERFEKDN